MLVKNSRPLPGQQQGKNGTCYNPAGLLRALQGAPLLGFGALLGRRAQPGVKSKLIVIPHTHWDREWYLPFQEFRFRLVQAMDELLDLLTRRLEYRHFTLDGQAVLLEDYLEIRPERRDQIKALVQEGRLSIGPWYVLPDQFLVSPEALIRNLLSGHQVAESFGGVLRVGYLPDPFGHVAQLPQLLRGFGIDAAVLWRGVGELGASELTWEAPDGSQVLVVHLTNGYNNAAALPSPGDGLLARVRQLAADLRQKAATEYLALMNGDDHATPQANVPELIAHANPLLRDAELIHGGLIELVEGIRASALRNGHRFPTIRGELRSPRFSPVLPGVMSARMWLKQRNAACEAQLERWAEPFAVLADLAEGETATPGARQRGFLRVAWRHLLQNHPHDSVTGCSVDQVHEEMRVRFDWAEQIAANVTRDALSRLAAKVQTTAARGSAEPAPLILRPAQVLRPAQDERGGLSRDRATAPGQRDTSGAVVVFNPEARARAGFAGAVVALPNGSLPALRDEHGRLVPSQILSRRETPLLEETISWGQLRGLARLLGVSEVTSWSEGKIDHLLRMARLLSRGRLPRLGIASFSLTPTADPCTLALRVGATLDGRHDYEVVQRGLQELQGLLKRDDVHYLQATITKWDEVEVGFVAPQVPALGYATLCVEAADGSAAPVSAWTPGPERIENEHFALAADPASGTVSVLDKATGRCYQGLNRFVDDGEAGDEYNHAAPPRDRVVDAPCQPARVEVTEAGPARATLLIEQRYALPRCLSDDRRERLPAVQECTLTTRLHLYPGVRRIEVETEVDNQACDHRLRVYFPTGLAATASHAESAFWVETRPLALPAASPQWAEQPVGTFPQRRFVDLSDGEHGLLLGVKGLPEYEVLDGPEGATLALTLLRCVGWLSRGDLAARPGHAGPMLPTPGAQCLGRHRFEYCLVPHGGDWSAAYAEAHDFALPLQAVAEESHSGSLPPSGSFLSLEGEGVVLAALKPAESGPGFVLRCYNTLPRPTRVRLCCGFKLAAAERLDLGEHSLQPLSLADPTDLELSLRPGELLTLRLLPAG
ncbi:MAG: hypothetical protein HY690_17060 [Chloroflexi bacterium]|nr:hypothetical protein [Chloroflexota bacterium]